MSGHENWIELADLYAAGALDGGELQEFSAHLSGCSDCKSHVRSTEQMLTVLPKSLTMVPAPAAIKERLMEQIGEAELAGAGVAAAPSYSFSRAAGLGMACLLVIFGAAIFYQQKSMQNYKKVTEQLAAPETMVIAMGPMEASPQASGKMMWNPVKSEGMFLASGLKPLPEGMVYELWAIQGSTPVAAGTFTVDELGRAKMELKNFPSGMKVEKFAVTLEPAGGLPQPTGAMHLIGSVA